jgi:hypothetical protein
LNSDIKAKCLCCRGKIKVRGQSKVGKRYLHKNDKNARLLHEQPTVNDQTWNKEILCQSIFLRRNQEVGNGHLIFAA